MSSRDANPLATADQLAVEDAAARLFASPPVREAMARCRRMLEADSRAATRSGQTTLGRDLEEMSFLACSVAALHDPDNPRVYWSINLPRTWFGRRVLGARSGIDNPDNIYRFIPLDDQASYVVSGWRPATPPADMTMNLFSVYPGDIDSPDGVYPNTQGMVSLKRLDVDPSGNFEVTVDPSPANGRRNHLQTQPGAKMILVRDSLSDWSRETPTFLSVKRVEGPRPKPKLNEAALTRLAAEKVERSVRFWLPLAIHYYFRTGPNQLFEVINPAFSKGGQYSLNGNYKIGRDEAYVLTLDPLGADYLGFQLADLFGASLDYANHLASLSHAQAAANPDGTITYVLALEDPGVHNWLDPVGLDAGLMMARYQGYDPAKVSKSTAIKLERVVKLSELHTVLPAGIPRVSAEQRRAQLAERLAAYNRRIGETKPERA